VKQEDRESFLVCVGPCGSQQKKMSNIFLIMLFSLLQQNRRIMRPLREKTFPPMFLHRIFFKDGDVLVREGLGSLRLYFFVKIVFPRGSLQRPFMGQRCTVSRTNWRAP
jgi:hypothetical protein